MKKYLLKLPYRNFEFENMVLEFENPFGKNNEIQWIKAENIFRLNKETLTSKQVSDLLWNGHNAMYGYKLKELEPLETIKMTKLDYEMLKFVQKQGAKYICRDENGLLNLFDEVPRNDSPSWTSRGRSDYFSDFTKQLFQFVTWESQKYYVIEDVLNNCEVVEDENTQ